MGPLRGGLIAATWAVPARAEACDREHPGWTPSSGEVGAWAEALHHATEPAALALLALVGAALVLRWRGAGVAVAAAAALLGGAVWVDGVEAASSPLGLSALSRAEGCAGPLGAAVAVWAAIGLGGAAAAVRGGRDAAH